MPIANTTNINIQVDVKKIIEQLNLSEHTKIMSPNKEAVILSKKIVSCFNLIK